MNIVRRPGVWVPGGGQSDTARYALGSGKGRQSDTARNVLGSGKGGQSDTARKGGTARIVLGSGKGGSRILPGMYGGQGKGILPRSSHRLGAN